MHNGWANIAVLLLGDPLGPPGIGGHGGHERATVPGTVPALGRSNNVDLHGGLGQGCDLLLHPVSNARENGAASRQDNVGKQVLPDLHITLHDGVVSGLMDTCILHTKEGGLEQGLWASESLVTNGDQLTIRKLVALLQAGALGSSLHLLLKVQGHIAQVLLNVTNYFTLSGGSERVATLCQDLHQVVSKITTSKVQTKDGLGKGITLIDGHSMGDTISRVEHSTSGMTRCIQGQHSLVSKVHGWGVEGLKHDLGYLFTVGLWIKGSLSQEDWVVLWGHSELVVEGVVPDLKRRNGRSRVTNGEP